MNLPALPGSIPEAGGESGNLPDVHEEVRSEQTLPVGWKSSRTPDGKTFYIDHVNQKTSWTAPTSQKPASSGMTFESVLPAVPNGPTQGTAPPDFPIQTSLEPAASGLPLASLPALPTELPGLEGSSVPAIASKPNEKSEKGKKWGALRIDVAPKEGGEGTAEQALLNQPRRMLPKNFLKAQNSRNMFVEEGLAHEQQNGMASLKPFRPLSWWNIITRLMLLISIPVFLVGAMWLVYGWKATHLFDDTQQSIVDRTKDQGLKLVLFHLSNCAIGASLVQTFHNFKRTLNLPAINAGQFGSDELFGIIQKQLTLSSVELGLKDGSYFAIDSSWIISARSNSSSPTPRSWYKSAGSTRTSIASKNNSAYNVLATPWYQKGAQLLNLANVSTYQEGTFFPNSQGGVSYVQPLLSYQVSQTVLNSPPPEFIGVVAVPLKFEFLASQLSSLRLPEGRSVFVYNAADKRLVASSGLHARVLLETHPDAFIQTIGKHFIAASSKEAHKKITFKEISYVCSSTRIRQNGVDWVLVTVVNAQRITDQLNTVHVTTGIMFSVLCLKTTLLAFVVFLIVPVVRYSTRYRFFKFREGVLKDFIYFHNGKIKWKEGTLKETDENALPFMDLMVCADENTSNGCTKCDSFSCIKMLKLQRPAYLIALLGFCFSCILIFAAVIRFVWSESLLDITLETSDLISAASSMVVQQTFLYELTYPNAVMAIFAWLTKTNAVSLNPAAQSLDHLFGGIMNSFTRQDGNASAFIMDMAYIGLSDGEMYGSQLYSKDKLRTAFIDSSTAYPAACLFNSSKSGVSSKGPFSHCYTKSESWPLGTRKLSAGWTLTDAYSKRCDYNPKARPWYSLGIKSLQHPALTNPYVFANGDVGLTQVQALLPNNDTNQAPFAVLSVDFGLTRLSDLLVSVAAATEKAKNIIYLVSDADWVTFASSTREQSAPSGGLLFAYDALNSEVKKSALIIRKLAALDPKAWSSSDIKSVPRLTDAPKTSTVVIQSGSTKLRLVMLADLTVFFETLNQTNVASVVLLLAAVLFTLLVVAYCITSITEYNIPDPPKDSLEQDLWCKHPQQQDLKMCSDLIDPLVKHWETVGPSQSELGPQIFSRSAAGENILYIAMLVQQGKLWIGQVLLNKSFQVFLMFILVLHVSLSVFRGNSTTGKAFLMAANLICILVESLALAARWYIHRFAIPRAFKHFKVEKDSMIFRTVRRSMSRGLDYATMLFLTCVIADFFYTSVTNDSFEKYFPFRAALLVVFNRNVFATGVLFLRTIAKASSVAMLFIAMGFILSNFSFQLFREDEGFSSTGNNSFNTFPWAMRTVLVFILGAENYSDTVYESLKKSGFNFAFWIVTTVVGLFFLTAMVLAIFQHEFSKLQLGKFQEKLLLKRIGLVACFLVINDDDDLLDEDEFEEFMISLQMQIDQKTLMDKIFSCHYCKSKASRQKAIGLQRAHSRAVLLKKKEDVKRSMAAKAATLWSSKQVSSKQEFNLERYVREIEDLVSRVKRSYVDRKICGTAWVPLLEHRIVNTIRLGLALCQLAVCSLYSLKWIEDSRWLDGSLLWFLLIYILEVTFVVSVYGFSRFWNYDKYHPDHTFVMFGHRMDFVTVYFGALLYFVSSFSNGCFPIAFQCNHDQASWVRLAFAMMSFRLISPHYSMRRLVNILFSILPRFWPIMELLLVSFNFFAVIGVSLFGKGWEGLDDDDVPLGSFITLSDGYLILWELLIGNNWSDTLNSTVLLYGEYVVWYYFLYIVVCTTLFTNLFLGILLDAFSRFISAETNEVEQTRRDILNGADLDMVKKSQAFAREAILREL